MIWPVDLAVPYPYSYIWTFWPVAGGPVVAAHFRWRDFAGAPAAVFHRRLVLVFGHAGAGDWPGAGGHSTHGGPLQLHAAGRDFYHGRLDTLAATGTGLRRSGGGRAVFLLAGAEVQLQYWRNSVTLFSHTVALTRDNILAEYNLAEALARQGDEAQAIVHYERALAIQPNRVEAHYNSQTRRITTWG